MANQVVILAGQSNALGQSTDPANLSGDYADYGDEFPGVRIVQQLQCPSDDGAAACAFEWGWHDTIARTNSQGEFGPEVGIVRSIPNIQTHGETYLVKCATGATDLANDWAEDATTGYVLYSRMKAWLENRTAQLSAWADGYEVVGMIWVQGEADSTVEAEANAYETNLNSFIAQARTDFNNATMPFIIARLNADNVAAFAATIRTAQDAVGAADSNVTVVNPDDIALDVDNVHYTEDGYAELGELLGAALDAYISVCG